MTKVVANHRLANRATLAVSTILDRVGALAETIKNDYGEDLIVQTQLNDEADNFRIYIQVKGTTLKNSRSGAYTFRLDTDHLRRWVSHIEPVLVRIYDQSTEIIYAFSPGARFSNWDLATTSKKSLSISISNSDIFNEDTARHFIWNARIFYYSQMLGV